LCRVSTCSAIRSPGPGDRATVTASDAPEVRIIAITGEVEGAAQLPLEASANTAGPAR
jgi:homoserine kinase